MFSTVLKGISTALLATILTLFAGIAWGVMGLGGVSVSRLVDIGLLTSCLAGGYRAGKESGRWLMGGAAGAGYVALGTALLALFLPIQGWGFIQVLGEGLIIGIVAGAFGAGTNGAVPGIRKSKGRRLNYVSSNNYEDRDYFSNNSDWLKQDSCEDWENHQEVNSIGRKKYQRQEKQEKIWALNEGADAEWTWDREERNKLIPIESSSELLVGWDENRVNTDKGYNKLDLNDTNVPKVKDSKPWWE